MAQKDEDMLQIIIWRWKFPKERQYRRKWKYQRLKQMGQWSIFIKLAGFLQSTSTKCKAVSASIYRVPNYDSKIILTTGESHAAFPFTVLDKSLSSSNSEKLKKIDLRRVWRLPDID